MYVLFGQVQFSHGPAQTHLPWWQTSIHDLQIPGKYKHNLNPNLSNGLSYPYQLDESIFHSRGVWCTFLFLSCFWWKFMWANSVDPDQMLRSAASDLGLHCLPMSQKWDARLIWVNMRHIMRESVFRDVLYWHKQETSALHLCLLIPNACRHFIQMFCINNADHSAMVCAKRNPSDEHKHQWQCLKHQYPNFKSNKISILCVPHVLTIVTHPSITEQTCCWDFMSARFIPYYHHH